MVSKPNVLKRPELSSKVEKLVPPDMRKIVEEIERDLSRLYTLYDDVQTKKPNDSQS